LLYLLGRLKKENMMPVQLMPEFVELSLPQDTRLAAAITNGDTNSVSQIFKEWNLINPSFT